jgi:hypothetical protein
MIQNSNTPPIVCHPFDPAQPASPQTTWLLRPCRFQWIDRLMIIACLVASLTTCVSLTLAQEPDEVGEATADAVSDAVSESAVAPAAVSDSVPAKVAPLSVEPLSADAAGGNVNIGQSVVRALNSGSRPDWMETVPAMANGIEAITVASDPKIIRDHALASLDLEIVNAVNRYIDNLVAVPYAHKYLPQKASDLRRRLIREGNMYEETVVRSVGTMHEAHAMLTIDAAFREDIQRRWTHVVTSMRLFRTGGIAIGILASLFVVFGYLRLDTVTRGYYSGRLRILGGLAILALMAYAAVFFRYNLEWLRLVLTA